MANRANRPVMIDAINTAVTLIEMQSPNATGILQTIGTATGFFYTTQESKYLITNKHVVAPAQNYRPTLLRIKVHTNPNSLIQNRFIGIPLYDNANNKLWLEPNPCFR